MSSKHLDSMYVTKQKRRCFNFPEVFLGSQKCSLMAWVPAASGLRLRLKACAVLVFSV